MVEKNQVYLWNFVGQMDNLQLTWGKELQLKYTIKHYEPGKKGR